MGIFEKKKPDFQKIEMDEMPGPPRKVNPVVGQPPVVEQGPEIPSAPIQVAPTPQPPRETVVLPVPNPIHTVPTQATVEPPVQEPQVQENYIQPQVQPQFEQPEPQEVIREVQVPVVLTEKELAKEQFNATLRIENKLNQLISLMQE